MTFWEDATPLLQAPLDQRKVKPAPQGKFGDYVDGFHVVEEANRIFGHGGWDYTITSMEMVCRVETTDRKGDPQIRVGYRCTVRAQVGVEQARCREGAAVGIGMAKPENEADAHESAVKEAETDALKRALRTFGYTFGLALYDKTKVNVQDAAEVERKAQASIPKHSSELSEGYQKDAAGCIGDICAAADLDSLGQKWTAITDYWQGQGVPVPIDVTGAYESKKAEFSQEKAA